MKTNIVETMKNGTTANINSTIEKTRSCLMQHLSTKTIYIFWCGLEKVHFQTNMISTVLITKNVIFKSPNSLIHFEKSYSCYQHFLFFTIIFRISSNFSRSLSFSGQFYLSWTCQHWACLIPENGKNYFIHCCRFAIPENWNILLFWLKILLLISGNFLYPIHLEIDKNLAFR